MPEITVRGAGIFGLSIAWACATRGALVQIIDPGGPGAGASGGLVGALAPHVPENWNPKKAFQLDSLLMAEAFWAGVEATGGVSVGYARTGRLQPVADEGQLALAERRSITAAELWKDHAQWALRPASEFEGWAPPSATGMVIHDTLSARLHPRQACSALTAALQVRGVPILTDGVDTGDVIWATGIAGLDTLGAELGQTVGSGVKGQAALLRYDAGLVQQLFVDALHLIPHADGTLAIGSTSERDYDDAQSTDAQLDDIIGRAVQALPLLHGAEIISRWAGIRPRARSRAPMLGRHPNRAGHFIANGGFKIGFGVAPKVGEVMADLVLEARDTIPDGFRVSDCL